MAWIVLESIEVSLLMLCKGTPVMRLRMGSRFLTWPPCRLSYLVSTCLPGGVENTVETPEHGERQDDLAVLRLLVIAPEQIGDAPDKAGDLIETLKFAYSIAV